MNLIYKLLVVIYVATIIPNTLGCHWARRRRSKRQAGDETLVWRLYFAECMSSMLADPTLDWTNIIDYSVLDAIWYIDVDTIGCTSAVGGHTGECWKNLLGLYIDANSPILTIGRTCIDRFVFGSSQDPPVLQFFSRKKRGVSFPPDISPLQPPVNITRRAFTNCLAESVNLPDGRAPLRFDLLVNFIEFHTTTKYSLCGLSETNQQGFDPSWPYRFELLTRTDSPLRRPIGECIDQVFPPPNFWSPWSSFSDCPVTCGSDIQVRSRSCRSGVDENNELTSNECPGGNAIEQRRCEIQCPDAWSQWTSYSECSESCGTGSQSRTRDCIPGNPFSGIPPQCFGSSSETRTCIVNTCPNEWAQWGNWGACTCDSEVQAERRSRECFSPNGQPLFPSDCDGFSTEDRPCVMQCAPSVPWVSWGPWEQWSGCSNTCGGGTRNRVRNCYYMGRRDSLIHGSLCACALESNSEETERCNDFSCRTFQWTQWTDSDCSTSCGDGTIFRNRICINEDFNEVSDSNCDGEDFEIDSCQNPSCSAVIWTSWNNWTRCQCFFGGPQRTRTRCNIFNCDEQTEREASRCSLPNCTPRPIQPQSLNLAQ